MNQRLVIPINATNEDIVASFKSEADRRNIPYTRAFAEAARLWAGCDAPDPSGDAVRDVVAGALDEVVGLVKEHLSSAIDVLRVLSVPPVYTDEQACTSSGDTGVHDPFTGPGPDTADPAPDIPADPPPYRAAVPKENPFK